MEQMEQMEQIIRDAGADVSGELREFNGQANHVHLPANFPPAITRLLAGQFADGRVLPQAAAGAPGPARPPLADPVAVVSIVLRRATGGAPISVLRQYIQQQDRLVRPD
jgi:putative transposase